MLTWRVFAETVTYVTYSIHVHMVSYIVTSIYSMYFMYVFIYANLKKVIMIAYLHFITR